jgi:hypothetical protein
MKTGRTTARRLVAATLGHFRCPRHVCGIVADVFGVGNQKGVWRRGTTPLKRPIR